ncbi:hypothetical protein BD626DRAFT_525839 [Schizophyllum amplum]|uniref:Secreted protein n=1 Tax=Schizophyllum amplum TaxID=97359 RepID=A0A550BSE6_9AGAR|nr:hypothetical protein BD626DRAFT_525839 [Auriculariopsis ampla]
MTLMTLILGFLFWPGTSAGRSMSGRFPFEFSSAGSCAMKATFCASVIPAVPRRSPPSMRFAESWSLAPPSGTRCVPLRSTSF